MSERRDDDDRPLADRRADAGAAPGDEPDFAGEHTPSDTDPPQASPSAPGGEDEGYRPPTQV